MTGDTKQGVIPLRDGMTWGDYIRQYNPDATDKEVDYVLWEETCYPMDSEETLKQIAEYYQRKQQSRSPHE